jgi:DnaJ-class molecular chaperone
MTLYDVLGISATANDDEIRKAYHQMIIAFHPDKYQGDKQFAAKKTHEIIEAYNVLRNPAARKNYDNTLTIDGRNPPNLNNRSTSASTHQYQSRYDEQPDSRAASFRSGYGSPKGANKLKVVFSVLGIVFVALVVLLFVTIMLKASGRWW